MKQQYQRYQRNVAVRAGEGMVLVVAEQLAKTHDGEKNLFNDLTFRYE